MRGRAGVWRRLHETLLAELRRWGRLDQRWTVVDSGSVRAIRGEKTGPNPTDLRKAGSKHHIGTDARGVALVAHVTAANVNEITHLDALSRTPRAAAPTARRPAGRPWLRFATRSRPPRRPRHCCDFRPSPHVPRQWPWRIPLGRRAHARLAPPVSSRRRSL